MRRRGERLSTFWYEKTRKRHWLAMRDELDGEPTTLVEWLGDDPDTKQRREVGRGKSARRKGYYIIQTTRHDDEDTRGRGIGIIGELRGVHR